MEMLGAMATCGAILSGTHWITEWMAPIGNLDMDEKFVVQNLQ
jgi:hypothetical protein